MSAIAAFFALLVAADMATTMLGLSLGLTEGNTLAAPTTLLIAKVTLLLPMLGLIRLTTRRRIAAIPGSLALALPVAHNLILLSTAI